MIFSLEDPKILSLIQTASQARSKAYIPFSKFAVGAALQCSDKEGLVITGCNVENVSFGLTICAERTAVVKAVSEGYRKYSAIAISAVSNSDFLVTPCGACRQVMSEFNANIVIYLFDPERKKVEVTSLSYLLPDAVLHPNFDLCK
mgnify:CR=1 FL=1